MKIKTCFSHAHKWLKPFKIILPRTIGSIPMKHGLKRRGLKSIIVYSSGDPVLTLAYFTAIKDHALLHGKM